MIASIARAYLKSSFQCHSIFLHHFLVIPVTLAVLVELADTLEGLPCALAESKKNGVVVLRFLNNCMTLLPLLLYAATMPITSANTKTIAAKVATAQ